jgi:anti-sigma regulatory factor (Ser/Thr protein kinase)
LKVRMKKFFKRNINSLEEIFDFLKGFWKSKNISNDALYEIELTIEEIFTNFVKYNSNTTNEIQIELLKQNSSLTIIITDFNVDPFNPLERPPYNTARKLEERPIGGVGIHLVKQYMDDIKYNYENRNSTITLIKHLGGSRV